ncbi:MAG: sulfite exporter TauE/SafE family protein [Chloroflexi bacterium]|nr:MAG: sulfite exporter TauE/SafE family protein [Chloroflexota bacterium]
MNGTIPRKRLVVSLAAGLVMIAAYVTFVRWQSAGYVVNADALLAGFLVGMLAQFVDGALGMAYGVTASTFLLTTGASPAVATAAVHMAEIFTTGASGLSHWRFGNIDRHLFRRLVIPGIIGAVVGVFIVTGIDGATIKPYIGTYLGLMGVFLVARSAWRIALPVNMRWGTPVVGFVGAFVDTIGGGGWGPVVTTTLLGTGHEPKEVIGSVSAAEFFITVVSGVALAFLVTVEAWETVAGLIAGGMVMAPVAAYVAGKLPKRILMAVVGCLIIGLNYGNILKVLGLA